MKDTVYSSTLTAKKIKSPKLPLFAVAALSAVCDILIVAALGIGGYAGVYFVCPALLLAFDALFAAFVLVTDFRFRYSIPAAIAYFVIAAALSAVTLFVSAPADGGEVMTRTAFFCCLAVHLLSVLASAACWLHAAKCRPVYASRAALVLAGVFVLAAAFYIWFVVQYGFFGQGLRERSLTYSYNEAEGYYEVTGVVDGRGDTVVVPETFNGEKVGAVDCGVFSAAGVSVVRFEGSAELSFQNIQKIGSPSLTLYTDKEYIDDFRNLFYGLAEREPGALTLANSFIPSGLAEDEIFVTFSYTEESLEEAEGKVFPTWFGKKGDVFDISVYEEEFPYTAHDDASSAEDLYWNDVNFGGKILVPLSDGTALLDGSSLQESAAGVAVGFEKIYRVTVGDDNDDVYETPDSYKQTSLGGETLPYLYTVPSRAESLFSAFPARTGFYLNWDYSADGDRFDDISSALEESSGQIEAYPEWTLMPAAVSAGTAQGKTSFVYGDGVTLTASASAEVEGAQFAYSWSGAAGSAGGQEYPLGVPAPSAGGTYTVTVRLTSSVTSLWAETTAEVDIEIDKKPLSFEWNIEDGAQLVYSAQTVQIEGTLVDGQKVNGGDVLEYSLSLTEARDAGAYVSRIILDSETSEKYSVASASGSVSFEITPYALTIAWGETSFTYDGQSHAPTASADALGGDSLTVTVAGARRDAGSYTATASVDDANYTISDPSCSFTIGRRAITLNWEDASFTYNGREQYPRVLSVENEAPGEENEILSSLGYGVDGGVNAGSHTVTATLGSDNYTIDGGSSLQYTIGKLGVTLTWQSGRTFTYDGQRPDIEAVGASHDGGSLSGSLLSELLGALTYGGYATDAGSHTMTAAISDSANFAILGGGTCGYTIEPQEVTLQWQGGQDFVFDGETHSPEAVCSVGGVEIVYEYYDLENESVLAGAPSAAGRYRVTAKVADGNYRASEISAEFTITAPDAGEGGAR